MLYKFLYSLADQISAFNIFRYITFRTFLTFITAFAICVFWGPSFIRRLVRKQVKQSIRDDGPETHLKKNGTPTMGGLLILAGVLVPSLLWAEVLNPYVLSVLIITTTFAAIGYIDDHLKISQSNAKGLPGKLRLLLEAVVSIVVIGWLVYDNEFSTVLHFPFFKSLEVDLGPFYLIFSTFVIVGCANAVNLTDGLDGLAIVPVMIAVTTFALFAYITGHYNIANYLQIPFISGVGELAPVAAAVVAAGLGFLWYNTYPAQVFMGDIGSLGLGGFLGAMAVLTKNEIILALVGGIFVVEALSVITQVVSFKLTGKRIFKMAPIHHHFELKGIDEPKLIVRFWIISILLAVLSLSTLKLR